MQTELQEEVRIEVQAEAQANLQEEVQVEHAGEHGRNEEPPVQATQKGCFYKRFVKRPLDFILALMALIILSPFMLIIALLVRISWAAR